MRKDKAKAASTPHHSNKSSSGDGNGGLDFAKADEEDVLAALASHRVLPDASPPSSSSASSAASSSIVEAKAGVEAATAALEDISLDDSATTPETTEGDSIRERLAVATTDEPTATAALFSAESLLGLVPQNREDIANAAAARYRVRTLVFLLLLHFFLPFLRY